MDQIELTKRAKRTIYHHFSNIDALGITDIKVGIPNGKNEDIDYAVTVTLLRPGLLIGKAGRTIYELSEILSEVLEGNTRIDIIESDLWKNLY